MKLPHVIIKQIKRNKFDKSISAVRKVVFRAIKKPVFKAIRHKIQYYSKKFKKSVDTYA